ncbi:hypothetical protein BGZ81_006295 [Podila clonocystis]|nr:hypothetical protein BGZ81_006295 [Podila clonocystis]
MANTLIQHIKKYADPNYSIDMSFLGNDMVSKTSYTQFFHTRSNLPKYEVYQKATGNVIDLEGIANMCNDEDEYIDLLRTRNTDVEMRLAPHDSNAASEILEFQFLDTPGMNDTEMRDEVFATDILEQIIIKRSFNLILIVSANIYR